jgi:2-polyprenyl-3-methyl-5-hydroxy-6-metoxy-1,4-benzoquinol methylase
MSRNVNWDTYTERLVALQGATATDARLLSSLARGRVLDAGCGAGIHLRRLAAAGVEAAVGVDMGMPGLRNGKSNCANAFFIAANLVQLPFRDNSFDFIYSIDVVEHLERPLSAIHEYHRVCKPGGHVFIQTPNYPVKRVYDLFHWIRGTRRNMADDPTHVSRLSAFMLKAMVNQVGLQVVSACARNIAFQRVLPKVSMLRESWLGHRFGQKIIVVALKP